MKDPQHYLLEEIRNYLRDGTWILAGILVCLGILVIQSTGPDLGETLPKVFELAGAILAAVGASYLGTWIISRLQN